jgi:nucleotide sugar dehydrogenase
MTKINNTAAIIGLGYVGLPLAVLAREKGWEVLGVDINKPKVELIQRGHVPFRDHDLSEALKKHPIQAGTDFSVVADACILIIAVPTPVTASNHPDLTPLTSAIANIKPYLKKGQTIVVESTVNPGVMDEVISPLLKDVPAIHLVHCPERINPGDAKWSVRNIPRVLGGYTKTGVNNAKRFYESVLEAPIKIMGSPTEAEAVKIMENTFRDINIAYINEMARSFAVLGIDITNVIAGAATKPFAFMPHYPGNGVGGHCISVDPYYMIERAKQVGFDHKFLKLARRINEDMPSYMVELLLKAAQEANLPAKQLKVGLLGLAYKKNVSDIRNSPALKTVALLKKQAISVQTFDPFIPKRSDAASLSEVLSISNAIMLTCDHTKMVRDLTPQRLQAAGIKIVIDGRNALNMPAMVRAGLVYYGIGKMPHPLSGSVK